VNVIMTLLLLSASLSKGSVMRTPQCFHLQFFFNVPMNKEEDTVAMVSLVM
jgi:hypothetical protein